MTCHAEIAAILKLPKNINMRKVTLLVVREGMKMSKPCGKCDCVIRSLGIAKVYYSNDGKIERL
jgi:cytidine deaminase